MRNQEFSCSTERNAALSLCGSVEESGVLNTAVERERVYVWNMEESRRMVCIEDLWHLQTLALFQIIVSCLRRQHFKTSCTQHAVGLLAFSTSFEPNSAALNASFSKDKASIQNDNII